ncbi:MAG: DNA mismatch repair protein MutS [Desulfovibrionaceae bacterium]
MTEKAPKLTPMFEQYLAIKKDYPHALLFYRMGDFYELFFDDAVIAARELQIALTSRNRDAENPVPMCGVPWHAVYNYTSQLVEKGFTIALCDQLEDPKASKGIVMRGVTRVLTPGTMVEDGNLPSKEYNFLGALFINKNDNVGGFAWVDVSTGNWSGFHSKKPLELWQWVQKMAPRELLIPDDAQLPTDFLLEGIQMVRVGSRSHFELKRAESRILEAQGVRELAALGLNAMPELVQACGALLAYLTQTQKQELHHLSPFVPFDFSRHLIIDEVTERNLEIFVRLNGRKGKGTLWHVMDETLSPMGGRLLQERLRNPWRDLKPIQESQEAVGFLFTQNALRQKVRDALKNINDLERISTRISLNRTNPRDFIALRHTLISLPAVRQQLLSPLGLGYATEPEATGQHLPAALYTLVQHWDNLEEYSTLLTTALVDAPPNLVTDGGIFKAGYNPELDALLDLVEHGEQKIQAMLALEQSNTGIPKLKLGYNKVFGYFFEITHAQHGNATIPDHFIRRQTLANAERFTTVALKTLEESILSAADKRKALEYQLFQELRQSIAALRPRLLFMADILASVDYWQSLAEVARRHGWVAPTLDSGHHLSIVHGRHPVVEAIIGSANFVPNDLRLDDQRRQCIITGPNMAGKSTILRQTALIAILAQMGSFVPAEKAHVGLVDRVFSRVGATDNLAQGQSTFMVEMMETARILRQSTRKSLVILDEIGRGTSTYDGLALAWAVVEELSRRAGGSIRTLFATHYHELTALEGQIAGVFTMNIAIREVGGQILFLHRLVPGPSDRSYGVEVARLAGVPAPVVQRARELLGQLEQKRLHSTLPTAPSKAEAATLPGIIVPASAKTVKDLPPALPHVSPEAEHPLVSVLHDIDPENLTPLQAFKLINEWKILWGTHKPA